MKRLFVAAALLLTPSLLPAAEAQPACGDTLTTDTTLTGDMSCAGTALRIGAGGITVNLNGFTLTGDGVSIGSAGIRNAGYNDVTIENGTVVDFFFGIEVRDGDGNRVVANRSEGDLSGIALINADDNMVAGNRVTGSVDHGLFVRSGSDNNAIRGNEFDSNGRRGILVSLDGGLGAPENNTFEGNHATGNVLFDVRDQTIGDGTAGTDSTYRGTRCDTSSPDGICVP